MSRGSPLGYDMPFGVPTRLMHLDRLRSPADLLPRIDHLFELSAGKIRALEAAWRLEDGAPVFTVDGRYQSRGLDRVDRGVPVRVAPSCSSMPPATANFWSWAARGRCERMAPHLTHVGVHDHGFNNVSTYGGLWRLAQERRIEAPEWEAGFYELALKVSGAVQARRWTPLPDGGYIYSFNGAHSLFVDTIRSLARAGLAHRFGHRLLEEQDKRVSLLERLVQHAQATARYSRVLRQGPRHVRRARTRRAREPVQRRQRHLSRAQHPAGLLAVFDVDARARLGDARLRRAARVHPDPAATRTCRRLAGAHAVEESMLEAARATCDFYIESATAADGVPYWDTGAPGLAALGDWQERPADPFNDHEPVDSSAAAIGAQGLLRLGRVLGARGADGVALRAGRPAGARDAAGRTTAVPQHRSFAPGTAAALDLSPAERLGPRARGLPDSARRIQPVGGLPCARGRAARPPAREERTVSDVLRRGHD